MAANISISDLTVQGAARHASEVTSSWIEHILSVRDHFQSGFRSFGSRQKPLLPLGVGAFQIVIALWCLQRMAKQPHRTDFDPKSTDPALLERHSETKCYSTSRFRYHDLRVFYRQHKHDEQLPTKPAPLPLLVFVHGLGGSVAQFAPLLTSITPIASCLAIDFPGCGRSEFLIRDWAAYTTDALTELLGVIIEDYRKKDAGQGVVLIGHSMGCSLSALLANPRPGLQVPAGLVQHVMGLVAICPVSHPPTEKQVSLYRSFFWIPEPIFNMWRAFDRRGGADSPSVRRFVGEDADPESKQLQNLYNNQSRTPVWRRMAFGALPVYENGAPKGGMPGRETWSGLNFPVFLIGGKEDKIAPPKNIDDIAGYLAVCKTLSDTQEEQNEMVVNAAAPVDSSAVQNVASTIEGITGAHFSQGSSSLGTINEDPSTPPDLPPIPPMAAHPPRATVVTILEKPATHALLYTPSTSRILAGLVCDFLELRITGRLSLAWQLQYLSRDGKWDVKNLEKWRKVAPVSEPIAEVFRAMKTLRGVDEVHCPEVFGDEWGEVIKDIIDISHDNPVYDPYELEMRGIKYHKFPTVSKVPPTDTEVRGFIELVDEIREQQRISADEQGWLPGHVIGVHCHYGFNRTGYFIVSYLVERCGYGVQQAIDLFARARPNGIKHEHFKNQLHLRYSTIGKASG